MKFQHNDPCYNIESGIENEGPALTRSETRGPKGLKMVFFVCFRAITFIPVDLFPWNFNIMILATK